MWQTLGRISHSTPIHSSMSTYSLVVANYKVHSEGHDAKHNAMRRSKRTITIGVHMRVAQSLGFSPSGLNSLN